MSITAEKECAKPSAHNRRHGVVSGECLCYKIKGWGDFYRPKTSIVLTTRSVDPIRSVDRNAHPTKQDTTA